MSLNILKKENMKMFFKLEQVVFWSIANFMINSKFSQYIIIFPEIILY